MCRRGGGGEQRCRFQTLDEHSCQNRFEKVFMGLTHYEHLSSVPVMGTGRVL